MKKALIIVAGVIGAVATVCTIAGCAIYSCIANFDNMQFLIDNCIEKESKN